MEEMKMNIEKMYKLDESFRVIRSLINAYWQKHNSPGINATHGRMLTIIDEHGLIKASAIADKLYITCGAVTGMSDRLIERGYIVREKNEKDRREVLLRLTEEGKHVVQDIRQIRKQLMEEMFKDLTSEEMDQGMMFFERLTKNMKN